MTRSQYIIGRKLNIIELGEKLGNISDACRKLGVSRQHFYDIKTALREEGIDGLIEESRKKPRIGNRLSEEIEKKILDYSLEYPVHGQKRVANELLRHHGIEVSDGGIRGVWLRHGIQTKGLRLKRLEKWAAENKKVLTEPQLQALESSKVEKVAHGEIETFHPGFLVSQDTLYVGHIKGIGNIYQQTGIDTYSNVGFAKVYTGKTALPAADFLNDKVLPFFDRYSLRVLRMLTDRGTEFCGTLENHPFQLFLHLNDIEHTTTKARHPQTNGACERMNQIILEEFYQVAFRKKLYKTLDEIQMDLDEYLKHYNEQRTNQGKRCQGKTPKETFEAGIELYWKYVDSIQNGVVAEEERSWSGAGPLKQERDYSWGRSHNFLSVEGAPQAESDPRESECEAGPSHGTISSSSLMPSMIMGGEALLPSENGGGTQFSN